MLDHLIESVQKYKQGYLLNAQYADEKLEILNKLKNSQQLQEEPLLDKDTAMEELKLLLEISGNLVRSDAELQKRVTNSLASILAEYHIPVL